MPEGHRKTFAASGAAAAKNVLSVGGGHAGAESVGAQSFKVVRLISSFHNSPLFVSYPSERAIVHVYLQKSTVYRLFRSARS